MGRGELPTVTRSGVLGGGFSGTLVGTGDASTTDRVGEADIDPEISIAVGVEIAVARPVLGVSI